VRQSADSGHVIGECKDVMIGYLACMKKVKGTNDPECRNIAKSYLTCRMDRYAPSSPPMRATRTKTSLIGT
jgi:hypothetical protein